MLSTGAINLENLVAIDGQRLEVTEAGASLFYTLDHPPGELYGSVSAFRAADPDSAPLGTMNVLHNIGARQLNIGAVESADLSQSLGAFNSADELQVSQPFWYLYLLLGCQDVLPEAEPHGGQDSDHNE